VERLLKEMKATAEMKHSNIKVDVEASSNIKHLDLF
jgi:hypothetical protein